VALLIVGICTEIRIFLKNLPIIGSHTEFGVFGRKYGFRDQIRVLEHLLFYKTFLYYIYLYISKTIIIVVLHNNCELYEMPLG